MSIISWVIHSVLHLSVVGWIVVVFVVAYFYMKFQEGLALGQLRRDQRAARKSR